MKKFFKSIILIILIGVLLLGILKKTFPLTYNEYIDKYSKEYGVDRALVYATIKAESNYNESASSSKAAKGLMQLTEETALWCAGKMGIKIDKDDITDPETNIKIGVWYLSYLIENTQSPEIAVISYNAGINKVKKWIEDKSIDKDLLVYDTIPYEETRNYIKKVMLYRQIYMILYNMR